MEQKNKAFTIRKSMWVVLGLFILGQLGDIITTLISLSKHKVYGTEGEILPLVTWGVPLPLLMVVVLIVSIYVVWIVYLKRYYSFNAYWRYFFAYFMVFIILLKVSIILNNIYWIGIPTEEFEPIPKDERDEAYNEQMLNMKITENLIPTKKQPPLALTTFLWSFIAWAVWYDWEKGYKCQP